MLSFLHIIKLMSGVHDTTELMSGAKSRKWVHQNPTNQPTMQNHESGCTRNQPTNQPAMTLTFKCLNHHLSLFMIKPINNETFEAQLGFS